jgi:tetratricopeptide (TPR) repeat protein
MEVLELSGCQYAGKAFPTELPPPDPDSDLFENSDQLQAAVGNWIADSVQNGEGEHLPEDRGEGKDDATDSLVNKWEIRRKNGELLEFETFSIIREWIEQGKIAAGDEISPSGGAPQKVEIYPGTADLFGNVLPAQNRQLFAAKPALQRLRRRRARQAISAAVVVLIAAGLAAAPFALRAWKIREGRAFVEGLIVSVSPRKALNVAALLSEATNFLREGTTESLPKASTLFMKALSFHPQDPAVLSALAETWIEIGHLTADEKEFDRARTLISYANALARNQAASERAEIRLLWRKGNAEEALARLTAKTNPTIDDQLLLARIAFDRSDFTTATIALSEALERDPNNLSLLLSLVEVFEKQSKFPEAASYLKRVESLAPDPEAYTEKLKGFYQKSGDTDALETIYRKSIAARSKSAGTDRLELVKLLASQNRNEEVIQESLNYFSEFPGGPFSEEIRRMYDNALAATQAVGKDSGRPRSRTTRSRSQRSR